MCLALCVLSLAAASLSYDGVDSVVPEDVDTPLNGVESLVDDRLLQATAKQAKHAYLGRAGQECTYSFTMLQDMSAKEVTEEGSVDEHKKVKVEYTLRVISRTRVTDGLEYTLQGATLLNFHQGNTRDMSGDFAHCSVDAIQGSDGHIYDKSVAHKPSDKCPAWMKNILVGSIKSLSPAVPSSSALTQIDSTDVFGTQPRRMTYHTQVLSNGETLVRAQGGILIEQHSTVSGNVDKKLVKEDETEQHTISGAGNVKKSVATIHLQVGDVDGSQPTSLAAGQEMSPVPKELNDSKHRPKESVQKTKGKVTAVLIKCGQSNEKLLQTPTTVADLLVRKAESGYVTLTDFLELPHVYEHIAQLPADQLSQQVTHLAQKLSSLSETRAGEEASQLIELPRIRAEILSQIHQGTLTGNSVAHELLNALGTSLTNKKMSSEEAAEISESLVAVASDDSLSTNTREQAVYAMVNDQCHDHRPVMEAIQQMLNKNTEDELGEFALQVQHGLMRTREVCSTQDQHSAIRREHTDQATKTESLLADAVSSGQFLRARALLGALSNSKLESHRDAITSVLESVTVPDHVRYGAVVALSQLHGDAHREVIGEHTHNTDKWTREAARAGWAGKFLDENDPRVQLWATEPVPTVASLMEASKDKGKGKKKKFCVPDLFSYNNTWPLPATGDFQAIGGLTAGADSSGAKGVASVTINVFGKKSKIVTVTAEKQGFGLCGENEPAILSIKLLKTTVYKRSFPKNKKKKDKKPKSSKKTKDTTELANPLDTEGFCMTKFGKASCLMGVKLYKTTFFSVKSRFQLGPLPCSASISLKGSWGLKYGIGLLGDCKDKKKKGKKKLMLLSDAIQAKKKKGKGKACAKNDGPDFNGLMVMASPYAKADLAVEVAIDLWVVKAGVSAEINLVKIGLPVVVEACIWGDCSNLCINTQLSTSAGGGRIFMFIKTVWSEADEWDILTWGGANYVWPKPTGEYTGKCTGAVPSPPPPPPPPALEDTDCIVEIYSKENYEGTMLKRCNTNMKTGFWCRVVNGGQTENQAKSFKMYGQCNKYEILDEDECKPGYEDNVMATASKPSIPWDLEDDICGVKIWAK